jgi:hypothetical protein
VLAHLGLTRWAAGKWIQRANAVGLQAVNDQPRAERPSQFNEQLLKALDDALSKPAQDYGLARNRWDGVVNI